VTGRTTIANPDNFVKTMKHLSDGRTLDVGSGNAHPHADVTLDVDPDADPDVVHNVEEGLPFGENEFENATAIHILEHVADDLFLLDELKRVARRRVVAVIPIGERDDPSHRRVYMPEDLDRFDPDEVEQSGMGGFVDAVMVWKF